MSSVSTGIYLLYICILYVEQTCLCISYTLCNKLLPKRNGLKHNNNFLSQGSSGSGNQKWLGWAVTAQDLS